jgi:hypothetical protein
MKIKDVVVKEMSIAIGNIDKGLSKIADKMKDKWINGEYVGDIEDSKILKLDNVYSMWDDLNLISYVSVTPLQNIKDIVEINYWTSPEYRGKRVISMFLWFLKTRQNFSKMIIGGVHSDDTINMLRNGGLSHFNKKWINLKTGETVQYDRTKDIDDNKSYEPYRSRLAQTEWRLMIENAGDFGDWPRFNKDANLVDPRMMYYGATDDYDE